MTDFEKEALLYIKGEFLISLGSFVLEILKYVNP